MSTQSEREQDGVPSTAKTCKDPAHKENLLRQVDSLRQAIERNDVTSVFAVAFDDDGGGNTLVVGSQTYGFAAASILQARMTDLMFGHANPISQLLSSLDS